MTEMHLCEKCAQNKGAMMQQHFGVSDLLAGLAGIGAQVDKEEGPSSLKCSGCGMKYADFKKTGQLGCSRCYDTFRRNLAPLIRRIHGSTNHIGKSPVKARKATKAKTEMSRLKERLEEAIKKEEFEEAARIRDAIKAAERRTPGAGGKGKS